MIKGGQIVYISNQLQSTNYFLQESMFSSREYIQKKTGPHGIGRFSYLQSLVTEFQETTNMEAKEQVLANLANFAYDPVNYEYFRMLNVLDLFLDCLSEDNPRLVEYAIGGLCNASLDKLNKEIILKRDGVKKVVHCLTSDSENTMLSTITTLMYLTTPQSKKDICTDSVVDAMIQLAGSPNKRISNIATIFIEDYCEKRQVDYVKSLASREDESEPS